MLQSAANRVHLHSSMIAKDRSTSCFNLLINESHYSETVKNRLFYFQNCKSTHVPKMILFHSQILITTFMLNHVFI